MTTHAHKNISCNTRYSVVEELSNKQSAKVICRFERVITSQHETEKPHEH